MTKTDTQELAPSP